MNLYVVVAVLVSLISCCSAIKCYECTMTELGAGDPKCSDPFYPPDPPYLKNCDTDVYTKCRKTKSYLENDKIRLVRECATQDCTDRGCRSYGGQTVCELCCYGDGCNGAVSVTSDIVMMTFFCIMMAGFNHVLY